MRQRSSSWAIGTYLRRFSELCFEESHVSLFQSPADDLRLLCESKTSKSPYSTHESIRGQYADAGFDSCVPLP